MLLVGVHRVLALQLELGALEQPAEQACVDRVFLGLGRFGGNAADAATLVYEFQEQARGIGHAHARGVHFGMDVAGGLVDHEFLVVLGVRQAGHEAHVGDRAVGTDVAVDAGGGAQRGIGRLAGDDDLLAAFVDHEVARGGPFQAGVIHLAEPLQRLQLRVVAELGHHGNPEEGQAEHVKRHDRAVQREGVGQRVGNRIHATGEVAAFPDDGVADAARLGLRALEYAVQVFEEVAACFFLRDFQQVQFSTHFSTLRSNRVFQVIGSSSRSEGALRRRISAGGHDHLAGDNLLAGQVRNYRIICAPPASVAACGTARRARKKPAGPVVCGLSPAEPPAAGPAAESQLQAAWMLEACLPFGPWVTSNDTF